MRAQFATALRRLCVFFTAFSSQCAFAGNAMSAYHRASKSYPNLSALKAKFKSSLTPFVLRLFREKVVERMGKVDKATVIFIAWILGTQLFAFLLLGPIKRYHGPEWVDIPFGQFTYAGILSLFGSILHSIAYVLLPINVVRHHAFAVIISLTSAIGTHTVLSARYTLPPITSFSQPEAIAFFYIVILSLSVGVAVTLAVVRKQ